MDPRPIHVQNVKYRPDNRTYLSYNLYDSMTFKEQPNIHINTRKKINRQNNFDLPKDYYFGSRKSSQRQNRERQIMRYQSMQLTSTKKPTRQELYAKQKIVNPQNKNNQVSLLDKQQSVYSNNSIFSRGGKSSLNNYSYAQQFVFQNQQKDFDIINLSNRNQMTRLKNFPKFTLEDKCFQFQNKNNLKNEKDKQKEKN